MHLSNKQPETSHFNDYVITSPGHNGKFLPVHERCLSSNSIYYQQGALSRKKLTVVSRDNLKPDFKGDYHMPQNSSSLSSSNRAKLQNNTYTPLRTNQSTQNSTQNIIQHHDSLKNSRVIKSKLKRSISPSPMTPTKILKLKKSMLNQKNQQSASTNRIIQRQQYSAERSLSRRKFESNQVSPMKLHIQSSHRRMLSAKNDTQSCQQTLRQTHSMANMQSVKKQLILIFNMKVLQLQSKVQYQQETIKILQNRINQNNRKLKQKQKTIQDLLQSRDRAKTMQINYQPQHVSINGKDINNFSNKTDKNYNYLIKRIKDTQNKFHLIIKEQEQTKKSQFYLNQKISLLQCQLVNFNAAKLNSLKNPLDQFLQQKSIILSELNDSITYLNNKLIGRTQTIKQLLCQLKQKVKQAEDTWTHKESRATKESTTLGLKQSEDLSVGRTLNVKKVQNRLKQLTSVESKKSMINSPVTVQGSLQFSLTSYDEDQNRINNVKNVYYDYNEMSDVSIGLQNCVKDQSSRLTDDFYYPGSMSLSSSRHASRNISPIINKKQQQSNQYYSQGGFEIKLCNNETNNKFMKKAQNKIPIQSPINRTKANINKINQNQPSPASQTTIKISNQTINKKIQCIQQLIETKNITTSEQIQKGQLRCYVDKTGYLKYTDSKTFVFDKKGNLIPCSEGEFWFLVTKGLIYGKRDTDESQTVSFIEIDQ